VHGKIFVSIHETCNIETRYVANVVIGTLEIDGSGEVLLLTSEGLESVNNSTICELFERSMILLWPDTTSCFSNCLLGFTFLSNRLGPQRC
jgi:hypothetical protein